MMIPYARQSIDQQDIDAVVEVLKSDFLTQGPKVQAFEAALCQYSGSQYAVVCNSATSALFAVYHALGLGPGKRLWTSPISFVATSNAALLCGADVEFVDVDPVSGNMDMQALRQKLETTDRLPDVVVPVHLAGQSCDMQSLAQLAEHYRFKVVEDASHALGADYQEHKVGACEYSDACVFSFHPIKSIAAGEGGAVLCNDAALADKVSKMVSHGIRKLADADQPWRYEQISLGHNFRLSDIHAALGLSQLSKLDHFIARRRELSLDYLRLLENHPVDTASEEAIVHSACHLFIVRLQGELPARRAAIFRYLRAHGVGVQVHYIPIHTQPYYRQLGFRTGSLPNAERFYASVISLPLYPDLTSAQQLSVVHTLAEALEKPNRGS